MFDGFLRERDGEDFRPFTDEDYNRYVDGKPRYDGVRSFLEGARRLGVEPSQAAVFEDALAGVEAGRAGRFGCVIGVDRVGQREALRRVPRSGVTVKVQATTTNGDKLVTTRRYRRCR